MGDHLLQSPALFRNTELNAEELSTLPKNPLKNWE
jgi:hypothetical protein